METLSLGKIASLTGYSRARIHQFAIANRIPGKILRKPPRGQFRYEDSPEIRNWCELKRKHKPVASQRKSVRLSSKKRSSKAVHQMFAALENGTAARNDIENAICLLDACRLLILSPNFAEQPVTFGALALMEGRLNRSLNARLDPSYWILTCQIFDSARTEIAKALESVTPPQPDWANWPSLNPPAAKSRKTRAQSSAS